MTRRIAVGVLVAVAACRSDAGKGGTDSARGETQQIVVYNAGSLARPLRAVLDSFAAATGVQVLQENAGSLETARKLTELGKIPDVVALADVEVFPQLLVPGQATWYARFARNRMVLAYTPRSRFAAEITPDNWWQVVQRPGVEVGRSDPNLDPNGYRTLLVFQLAERYYRRAGLERALLAAAPARNVRPKEADLVGLVQAGELDYAWSYESLAQSAGLRFVVLPTAIDLSAPADSATYATAVVRVAGRTPRDTLALRGQPISYALLVPTRAPHPAVAARFIEFLFSPAGTALLRGAHLDVLDTPIVEGTGAPAGLGAPR
jgi:molybdate/tungstate transport system substrate-binding protein